MEKEQLKELLIECDAMDEDDEILDIKNIDYDCMIVRTTGSFPQLLIGESGDIGGLYLENANPSEILYCTPNELASFFNLPDDMFSESILEKHDGDDDFALQICEATGKDYKDILNDYLNYDGIESFGYMQFYIDSEYLSVIAY